MIPGVPVPIVAAGVEWKARAEALAARFCLPLGEEEAVPTDFLLVVTACGVELRSTASDLTGPVRFDFVGGRQGYRNRHGGGIGQPLARAVGLRFGRVISVLDATAGQGRDAFVLASLGCSLTLIERSPVVAALLHDAIHRATLDPSSAGAAARMDLHFTDSMSYLSRLGREQRPDVVYLDPMYPHRRKSALVKKEMRILRRLVGDDQDAPALLAAARVSAAHRVVVKRPAGSPWLGGEQPSMEISLPNTRYDVYVVKGFATR